MKQALSEEEARLNDTKAKVKNQFLLDKTQADARKLITIITVYSLEQIHSISGLPDFQHCLSSAYQELPRNT